MGRGVGVCHFTAHEGEIVGLGNRGGGLHGPDSGAGANVEDGLWVDKWCKM